ncbi:MAG: hypothetical protein SGCHY_001316 [Lobulomycetales sp.]
MARNLLWKDFSLTDLDNFYACSSQEDSYEFLGSHVMKIEPPFSAKQNIVLDMYYHALAFAKSLVLSPEQTSVLFSLIKETHEHAVSSPFITFEKDFLHFKNLLLAHAINRPPYSIRIFSLSQVKSICDWATQGYFRHYLMYKFAFTRKVGLNLTIGNYQQLQAAEAEGTAVDMAEDGAEADAVDRSLGQPNEGELVETLIEDQDPIPEPSADVSVSQVLTPYEKAASVTDQEAPSTTATATEDTAALPSAGEQQTQSQIAPLNSATDSAPLAPENPVEKATGELRLV